MGGDGHDFLIVGILHGVYACQAITRHIFNTLQFYLSIIPQ